MAGRRPTPTKLKLLTGNPGKRPLNRNEPSAPAGNVTPPDHLEGFALAMWNDFVAILGSAGMALLTDADRTCLELACMTYAEVRQADAIIADEGMTYECGGENRMVRAHPAVAIRADAMRRLKGLLIEFGMTPAARSRVSVQKESTAADVFAALAKEG